LVAGEVVKFRNFFKSLPNCFSLLFEKHGGVAEEFSTERVSKSRHKNETKKSESDFKYFSKA